MYLVVEHIRGYAPMLMYIVVKKCSVESVNESHKPVLHLLTQLL